MKRILSPIAIGALSALFITCQKPRTGQQIDWQLARAQKYFTDSLATLTLRTDKSRTSCLRTPMWSKAYTATTSCGPTLVVPVAYSQRLELQADFSGRKLFAMSDLARLVFYQDHAGRMQAEMLTAIPDTAALRSGRPNFTGVILVETWAGERLDQLRYASNGSVCRLQAAPSASVRSTHTTVNGANPVTPDQIVTNCETISGYNYSADNPGEVYSWTETIGCSTIYIPDIARMEGLSPADLGGLGIRSPNTPVVTGGSNPITDVAAYFKCFTNSTSPDHTYSVAICVSQPVPGTRDAWVTTPGGPIGSSAAANPVNVGHTFLVLTENSAGTTIVRNVGFYPQTNVNPAYPSDQGQLDNNELTGYNISLTYTVTNAQFFDILSYVSIGNNTGYFYDLSTNNCTTFALHGLAAGGIDLPTTQGSWLGGSGDDPGDLGEDIRSMVLPPNATRNTVSNPHPNQGSCN